MLRGARKSLLHRCPDDLDMAAFKSVQVLRREAQKSLLHRLEDNNVDMSVQFMAYTWWKVRISRDKGALAPQGGQGRKIIPGMVLLWDKAG